MKVLTGQKTQKSEYDAVAKKLRAMGVHVPPRNAYLKTFGLAKNDPTFDEATDLGAEWRAQANRKPVAEAAR
jgi:hypothetical protein